MTVSQRWSVGGAPRRSPYRGALVRMLTNDHATTGLQPLDLHDEPGIAVLIERVDADDRTT